MNTSKLHDGKYTLIINYPTLSAGGIEKGLVSMMRYYLREGHRVIWITTEKLQRTVAFEGLLNNPQLEIIIWEKWSRFLGVPQIHFQTTERVIMLSCCAMHYAIGEELKRKAQTQEFKHYCVLAHYTGEEYYPDLYMKTRLGKQFFYQYWQNIVRRIVDNNCLLGFSKEHLESYEAYYHIPISNKVNKLLPIFEIPSFLFDEENTKNREQERQDKFVITTCSRFEFPHKAYILGLVDSYSILKQKYPQVVLQIIGGGAGEEELRKKISELPEYLQHSILLTGVVSPDNLQKYYKNSHVIVGLAGAIVQGALSGIPSIVVRHYCNVCETYGFFEDAFEKTLSEDEGVEITPLLEHCITMGREEYLQHGQQGLLVIAKSAQKISPPSFEQQNVSDSVTVCTLWERIIGRILYVITELKNRFEE